MAGLELLVGAGAAVGLCVALAAAVWQRRMAPSGPFSDLRALAARQGFSGVSTETGTVLRGTVRGFGVELRLPAEMPATGASGAEVAVALAFKDLPGFSLDPDRLGLRDPQTRHAASPETGEDEPATPGLLRPLLRDSRVRGQLAGLFSRWPAARIEEGVLRFPLEGGRPGEGPAAFRAALQVAAGLSSALRRVRDDQEDQRRTPGTLPVCARFSAAEPEATLSRWLVEVGEAVERGQPLCELLTRLGTVLVSATTTGEVVRRVGLPGRTVKPGSLLVEVEAATGEHRPAHPLPPNASGLELLDLDRVVLQGVDAERAAQELRLDVDSPRPPRPVLEDPGSRDADAR